MFDGDVRTPEGLEALNAILSDQSYVNGYIPGQIDSCLFEKLGSCPSDTLPHVCRWYRHIASFGLERKSFAPNHNSTEDCKTSSLLVEESSEDSKTSSVLVEENGSFSSLKVRLLTARGFLAACLDYQGCCNIFYGFSIPETPFTNFQ